ncbi:MAG: BamA/TamA family outer membrane protein, partial [Proteobacteria bacterium]|nr:BamA/TamA family outer membrane protein [Pseudomonadota bacterium]
WIDCGYTDSPSGGSRRTLLKSELRYRWTPSIATTSFIDSGNTSFSAEEMAKFQKSFAGVVDVSNPSACPNAPVRRIVDNVGYELEDLPSHPEYIWERHYTSGGAAVNFLTPIGSINLAYGVPWHEPKSDECKTKNQGCRSHIPERDAWWRKGEIHFNVGAKF